MPQCNAECACCYEIRPSVGQDGRGAASSEGDGRRVVERGRMPGTRSGLTFGMIACALLISTSGCSSSGNSTRDSTSPSSEPPSSPVSASSSSASSVTGLDAARLRHGEARGRRVPDIHGPSRSCVSRSGTRLSVDVHQLPRRPGEAVVRYELRAREGTGQGVSRHGARSPGASHGEPHGRVFAVGPAAGLRRWRLSVGPVHRVLRRHRQAGATEDHRPTRARTRTRSRSS